MVFGIFKKKIDRVRIIQNLNRTEHHFQNIISGSENPLESILEEFAEILSEIAQAPDESMLEPLLRFEELSTEIVSGFYSNRICSRMRGSTMQRIFWPEVKVYEAACIKHHKYLDQIEKMFHAGLSRNGDKAVLLLNRQFHWLCELTKVCCITGVLPRDSYFDAANNLLQAGTQMGVADVAIAPYRNLYPEERVSLRTSHIRQYLIASFFNSELPACDVEVANVLWRIRSVGEAEFTESWTSTTTHFLPLSGTDKNILRRVFPEMDEKTVSAWFSAASLPGHMGGMTGKARASIDNTALGEFFGQILSDRSIERIADFFSLAATRKHRRVRTSIEAEVFSTIIGCICHLRRINEEYLIGLSDMGETQPYNLYDHFDNVKFGYVEGHVNQTLKSMSNESIVRELLHKIEVQFGTGCGIAPMQWYVDDVSVTGYGLVVPRDCKAPEIGGIIILSKEDVEGIEFAVARRFRRSTEKDFLGVKILFAGYKADPIFIEKYIEGSSDRVERKPAEPYGFLLDGGQGKGGQHDRILLMSKKDRYPKACKLTFKTIDKTLEGIIGSISEEGSNWVAYRFVPAPIVRQENG